MKFRFRNIGPIEDAALELGRLTIIAGRNNTGKTYLAYTLYGFLKQWMGWPGLGSALASLARSQNGRLGESEDIDVPMLTNSLISEGDARRRVSRATLSRERATIGATLARDFSATQLARVLSASPNDFENARLSIEWDEPFPTRVSPLKIPVTEDRSLSIEFDGTQVVWRLTGSPKATSTRHIDLDRFISSTYISLLMSGLPSPFVLTAERLGISLFYRELDFTKNQLVQLLQQLREGDRNNRHGPFWIIDRTMSRYASPIKDNIDYTRSLPDIRRDESDILDARLHDDIRRMMDGYYTISGGEVRFASRRRASRFNLPLHQASSSARGLSDFYFYLQHAAHDDHLLIVDEPESHLDTENQVAFTHLLAKIVKRGIRVLVTTHSDYIAKEINNLLMLGRLGLNEEGRRAVGYREDLALENDQVRAYVAGDSGLHPCDANAYGLDFPVFEKTIESINRRARGIFARVMEREEVG